MDWWSFLTRNGHGNRSLHIEYQICSRHLRWCTSKCLALCSPQITLNMLRSYILLISIWCRLSLYVLCSDIPSLLKLLCFTFQDMNRYTTESTRWTSHIDRAIVWWWSMASIRCVNSLHTRWYAIHHCSCLFVERIPGCWGWSAK